MDRRLLSANVMPTVPSAPVTTLSACCTGMPARTAMRSVPRSMCAAPRATLISPTSAANAPTTKPIRQTANIPRMLSPDSLF
jgi:hypothetical protein